MQKSNPKKPLRPPQKQEKPGEEIRMIPKPVSDNPAKAGCGKLTNKIAFITGGDSGIGKAVAILFAKEGADIALSFLNEDKDAEETRTSIEKYGRKCLRIPGDISKENNCTKIVAK